MRTFAYTNGQLTSATTPEKGAVYAYAANGLLQSKTSPYGPAGVPGQTSNGVVMLITSNAGPAISWVAPDTGAAGSAITIYGSSFGTTQGGSTVTFNGTPATEI